MPDQDVSIDEPVPGGIATLAMLAKATIKRAKVEISVAMPAEVVSWSAPVEAGDESRPAMIRARPHYKYARKINQEADLEPGEVVDDSSERSLFAVGSLPEIPNVPVLYPGPAGMQSRGPLEAGETGILIVNDKSIDDWIQTGGPIDPVLYHRHNMSDAVFLPGLRYGTNAQQISPTLWLIGKDDGSAGMSIDKETANLRLFTDGPEMELDAATSIKLGASAALAAIRQSDPVNPGANMIAWAITVETFANTIAPGTFTPANSFATTVAAPANSGRFGSCGTGSGLVTIG